MVVAGDSGLGLSVTRVICKWLFLCSDVRLASLRKYAVSNSLLVRQLCLNHGPSSLDRKYVNHVTECRELRARDGSNA